MKTGLRCHLLGKGRGGVGVGVGGVEEMEGRGGGSWRSYNYTQRARVV